MYAAGGEVGRGSGEAAAAALGGRHGAHAAAAVGERDAGRRHRHGRARGRSAARRPAGRPAGERNRLQRCSTVVSGDATLARFMCRMTGWDVPAHHRQHDLQSDILQHACGCVVLPGCPTGDGVLSRGSLQRGRVHDLPPSCCESFTLLARPNPQHCHAGGGSQAAAEPAGAVVGVHGLEGRGAPGRRAA